MVGTEPNELESLERAELERRVTDLERAALPVRARLEELRKQIDVLRTELRRRERLETLAARKATRTKLAGGGTTLEQVVAGGDVELDDGAGLDAFRFLRDSGTEVRLGYASAGGQTIAFTDGAATDDAATIAAARALWERGWDFGTPAARGVRIYAVGSRAERVVAATEVHIEPR